MFCAMQHAIDCEPRLLGCCPKCRIQRFTDENVTLAETLENAERQTITLRNRVNILTTTNDVLRKELEKKEKSWQRAVSEGAAQERVRKKEIREEEKWRMEAGVEIERMKIRIEDVLERILRKEKRKDYGEVIEECMEIGYELGMKRKREKGFNLLEMVVMGELREGDKLIHKGREEGELIVGGGDVNSIEVGVGWMGMNYRSVRDWISGKEGKKVAKNRMEKTMKEITVVRDGWSLGNLGEMWSEHDTTEKEKENCSDTKKAIEQIRDSDVKVRMNARISALRGIGEEAVVNVRRILVCTTHSLCSFEDACIAITEVLRCWARVSEFLQLVSIYLEESNNANQTEKDDMDVTENIK